MYMLCRQFFFLLSAPFFTYEKNFCPTDVIMKKKVFYCSYKNKFRI